MVSHRNLSLHFFGIRHFLSQNPMESDIFFLWNAIKSNGKVWNPMAYYMISNTRQYLRYLLNIEQRYEIYKITPLTEASRPKTSTETQTGTNAQRQTNRHTDMNTCTHTYITCTQTLSILLHSAPQSAPPTFPRFVMVKFPKCYGFSSYIFFFTVLSLLLIFRFRRIEKLWLWWSRV